jgi:hypothetical protein
MSKGLVRKLKKLLKPVKNIASSLKQLDGSVLALQKQIEKSNTTTEKNLPNLPDASTLADSDAELRVASMSVIVFGVILLGLMLVNTGMLSQILRDLDVIPATLAFLAYFFASLLTLLEAGIGAAHAWATIRRDDSEKFKVLPTFSILLALIVSFVEGSFYSRIASPTTKVMFPFLNYEMLQTQLFFLWGFGLVWSLFLLGLICFKSGYRLRAGNARTKLEQNLEQLRRKHDHYKVALKNSEEALKNVSNMVSETDKMIKGPATNAESVQEELDRVTKEIQTSKTEIPDWAKDKPVSLTRTEVHHFAQTGGLWLLLASAAFVFMTYAGLRILVLVNPTFDPTMHWFLALLQAICFLGSGFLLSSGETIVQGNGGEQKVWAVPRFSRWAGYILGGILLLIHLVLFFAFAWPMGFGTIWFLNLASGLGLLFAGYMFCPLLYVVRLCLWRFWNALVFVLESFWYGLNRLFEIIVIILEHIAYLFATPLVKILGGKRNTVAVETKKIETDQAEHIGIENQRGERT